MVQARFEISAWRAYNKFAQAAAGMGAFVAMIVLLGTWYGCPVGLRLINGTARK